MDTLITTDEKKLHARTLAVLKKGARADFSFRQKAEEKGCFHVKARVDPENKIAEINEGNNETAKKVKVLGAKERIKENIKEDIRSRIDPKKRDIKKNIQDFRDNLKQRHENLRKEKKKIY